MRILAVLLLTGCATQPPVPTGSLDSQRPSGSGWVCTYLGAEGEGYATIESSFPCARFTYKEIFQ